MELTFLGTGAGSTMGSKRFKSGLLVSSGATKLVLDMGSGANYRLEDLNALDVQALFVTHLHVDHFSGLLDHLVVRKLKGLPTLKVYSPPGLRSVLEAVKLAGNNVSAEVEEAELPKAKVGDLEVYSVKACHSIYAVAYVVTDGRRRVLYSGDTTEPCETILEEARDADLVVHEASCVTGCDRWGHTGVRELLDLIPREKLVLTHIPSWLEGEIIEASVGARVAHDGMRLNV